jgi:hypothetical protein
MRHDIPARPHEWPPWCGGGLGGGWGHRRLGTVREDLPAHEHSRAMPQALGRSGCEELHIMFPHLLEATAQDLNPLGLMQISDEDILVAGAHARVGGIGVHHPALQAPGQIGQADPAHQRLAAQDRHRGERCAPSQSM